MPIDEKDQWTARRLKLAFAVADSYVVLCDAIRNNEPHVANLLWKHHHDCNAYVAFIDAGKPKAKGKSKPKRKAKR